MKQHWLAIILAVVTGLIVGLPHILIPRIIAPAEYDPLQFNADGGSSITMEEVYTYVPEVREILEGKFWVTDTQVAEYNGKPTPFFGESGLAWIMSGLTKLTGSIQNAFVIADIVFPTLTFILVYALVWSFTKDQFVSAATGTVLVIWPELWVLFPYPNALISAAKEAVDPRDFLFISRNFHPQLSLSIYLGAFALVLLALERRKTWLSILAGAAVGFLVYTYIFNWTAFGLGLILFLMYKIAALVVKRSDLATARSDLMKFLVIVIVAGIVASPYFFHVWQFRQSGLAADFFTKLSLPKRGFFDLIARHIILLALFIWFNRKKLTAKKILFISFWLAPLIFPDLMQNFLGRDLEGKHWVRRIAHPFGIMGLGIGASQIINKKWNMFVCLPLIILVLVYGLIRQAEMSYKIFGSYALNPDKQELYDWINQNTPPGSVIASLSWDTVVNIPAKTHAFNFSPIGMRTIASTDETIDRFSWTAAIYGASNEYIEQAFSARGDGTTRALYFKFAQDDEAFAVPSELTQDIKQRYQTIVIDKLKNSLLPFRLDYVLIGETEKKLLETSGKIVSGEIVFSNSNYNLVRYTR